MTKTEQTKFLDECAMRAMQKIFVTHDVVKSDRERVAHMSYEMAEAMLKEKLKREEGEKLF